MKDVVSQVRRRITPQMDQIYNLVGIRLYCGGARIHGNFNGDTLQAPSLNRIELGDIIYNKMWASKGTFALVGNDVGACYGTTEYPVFRAIDGNSEDFIFRVLSQPRFWKRAEAWSSGSTDRTRLNPEDFLMLPIPTPPPTEQRAIAGVLGSVEAAIARTKALIDAIGKAKYAIMRELLTRGVRRDKVPLKALPDRWVLGRVAENVTHIPRDWALVTLTAVAKLESGHTPSREKAEYWGGDIPWLSLADTNALDALEVSETSEGVTPKGISNSSARILPKETVVFSRTATVGKATRMARPMATSQDFANWICGPKILPAYLVQVFRHMDREWQRLQEGSTHQTIYMPVFKKLQVLLPSTVEQEKISNIGEAFDRRLERERDTLAILIENRAALAQELLSGRLRLPKSIIARHRDAPAAAA
jgi:type I restriction enzyme S subunit